MIKYMNQNDKKIAKQMNLMKGSIIDVNISDPKMTTSPPPPYLPNNPKHALS